MRPVFRELDLHDCYFMIALSSSRGGSGQGLDEFKQFLIDHEKVRSLLVSINSLLITLKQIAFVCYDDYLLFALPGEPNIVRELMNRDVSGRDPIYLALVRHEDLPSTIQFLPTPSYEQDFAKAQEMRMSRYDEYHVETMCQLYGVDSAVRLLFWLH